MLPRPGPPLPVTGPGPRRLPLREGGSESLTRLLQKVGTVTYKARLFLPKQSSLQEPGRPRWDAWATAVALRTCHRTAGAAAAAARPRCPEPPGPAPPRRPSLPPSATLPRPRLSPSRPLAPFRPLCRRHLVSETGLGPQPPARPTPPLPVPCPCPAGISLGTSRTRPPSAPRGRTFPLVPCCVPNV